MSAALNIGDRVRVAHPGYYYHNEIGVVISSHNTHFPQPAYEVRFADGAISTYLRQELELLPPIQLPVSVHTSTNPLAGSFAANSTSGPYSQPYTFTPEELQPTLFDWAAGAQQATSNDQRKKWKEEGRCETCGDLLPISIWGLGDCPKHPKTP